MRGFQALTIVAGRSAALWAIARLMRAVAAYGDGHMSAINLCLCLERSRSPKGAVGKKKQLWFGNGEILG